MKPVRKRRMRRPVGARPPHPDQRWPAPDTPHPLAVESAAAIAALAHRSGLDPFRIFVDLAGMLEASLRFKAANLESLATTGRVIDDPPPVKAHFQQARERYLQADARCPGLYRQMQETFLAASAHLTQVAAPGLTAFADQTDHNPDFIGQIFLTLLEPGPVWRQFFPPWAGALATARRLLPNPDQIVDDILLTAVLRRKQAGQPPITLIPGENFEAWFNDLEPYLEPPLIGPVPDSATMLAVATCFPAWMVRWGVVRFGVHTDDPLLGWLTAINIMLYGLNGYELELTRTASRIIETPPTADDPAPAIPPPLEVEATSPTVPQDPLSFSALFRGQSGLSD